MPFTERGHEWRRVARGPEPRVSTFLILLGLLALAGLGLWLMVF